MGDLSRERPALGRPPAILTGFPRWRLTPSRPVFRAHRHDRCPWWFSSDLSGRFDLVEPSGTCYLAATPATALRERWGQRLVRLGRVSATMAEATVLSKLSCPRPLGLGDARSGRAAAFGLTSEIGTLTPYSLPQAWAAALARAGCEGIRYGSRFSTGPRDLAYAVFGPAGVAEWPVDPSPTRGRSAAVDAGLAVLPVPHSLHTTRPPG